MYYINYMTFSKKLNNGSKITTDLGGKGKGQGMNRWRRAFSVSEATLYDT